MSYKKKNRCRSSLRSVSSVSELFKHALAASLATIPRPPRTLWCCSLSLCMRVPYEWTQKRHDSHTHTHTHTQLWHAGSLPYPVLSQNPLSKTVKGVQMRTWTSQHTEAHRDVQKSTGSSLCTHRPMRVKRSANHERKRGVKGRWGNIGKFR